MVGIISYGAYIPLYRLSRDEIAKAWGRHVAVSGERAVANFDEDSITMAVAAAMDCLSGTDRNRIDSLYFASASSPYKEKQSASIVATALNLRRDVFTTDCSNSLRSGTNALRDAICSVKAGLARGALVAAADCRLGAPGSDFEQLFGDGAGALLIGDSAVAVEVEAMYSHFDEILDNWRTNSDPFVRSAEDRFAITEGYMRNMEEAGSQVMSRYKLRPGDFAKAVLYAPDPRRQRELARALGFDPKVQLQDGAFEGLGNTGAAFALMQLVAALEEAKPGDRLLLMNYGDGCDAFVLRVTDEIEKIRERQGIKKHLGFRRSAPRYGKYLRDRALLTTELGPPRPPPATSPTGGVCSSPSYLWRDREMVLSLSGSRCRSCGRTHFPPQRVCMYCKAKDDFERVALSDRKGTLVGFSRDHLLASTDPPEIVSAVNLEGDVRVYCYMTDRDPENIEIGMPLEMTFRKMHEARGYMNYFWKCRPLR